MKREMLKGHLDTMLLAVIARGPVHGYAIIEALTRTSDGAFALPEGTVYPALHRLERSGLLASRWTDGSGRRRRTYELTRKGNTALTLGERQWTTFARAVTRVLEEPIWAT